MKYRITHFFYVVCFLYSVNSPALFAQQEDADTELKQAETALEQAKTALEQAQGELIKAQKAKIDKVAPAPKVAKRPSDNNSGRLYKWVDADGNISYQDSPPPKNVKVLNSDVLKDSKTSDKPIKELSRATEPEPLLDGSVPIRVYTADNCKPCQSVVLFLTQNQVPFIERDIRTDRKARERLSNMSKQISVPSLFIGERIVQGHAKPMIRRALEEAGYLEPQK